MKLKYYMRGLGVGILFSTIILSISLRASSRTQLTDDEIIKRAEQLGMVKTDENSINLDDLLTTTIEPSSIPTVNPSVEPETVESKEEPETVESKEKPTIIPTKVPTAAPTKEPTAAPTPEPTAIPTIEPTQEPTNISVAKQVTVEIEKGMTSEKVALLLKESGVIQDAKQFNKYMVEYGHESNIIAGKYQIATAASYSHIMKMITR